MAATWGVRLAAARMAARLPSPALKQYMDSAAGKGFVGAALTLNELSVLREIADARGQANRSAGVRDGRRTQVLTSEEVDFQGIVAEYGVMRIAGAAFDPLFDTSIRNASQDVLADLQLPGSGATVDVKSVYIRAGAQEDLTRLRARRRAPGIYLPIAKRSRPADAYVLAALVYAGWDLNDASVTYSPSVLTDAFSKGTDDAIVRDSPLLAVINLGYVSGDDAFTNLRWQPNPINSFFTPLGELEHGLPG